MADYRIGSAFAFRLKAVFAGAVSLVALQIVLCLLCLGYAPLMPQTHASLYVSGWTIHGVYASFAIAASIGGGAGFYFCKTPSRAKVIWINLAVASFFPLVFGLWLFYASANGVVSLHRIKLADCKGGRVNIKFPVPKGFSFRLYLITPEFETMRKDKISSSYKFTANVRIFKHSAPLETYSLDSKTLQLGTRDPFGIPLTGGGLWYTNLPALDAILRVGDDCRVEAAFTPAIPARSSIWLYWEETGGDRNATSP